MHLGGELVVPHVAADAPQDRHVERGALHAVERASPCHTGGRPASPSGRSTETRPASSGCSAAESRPPPKRQNALGLRTSDQRPVRGLLSLTTHSLHGCQIVVRPGVVESRECRLQAFLVRRAPGTTAVGRFG